MPRMKDLEIDRISLVAKPATGIRFLVVKQEGGLVMEQALQDLVAKFLPDGKLPEEVAKAELSEDALKGLKETMTAIETYRSEFPSDLTEAIGKLAVGSIVLQKTEVPEIDSDADEAAKKIADEAAKAAAIAPVVPPVEDPNVVKFTKALEKSTADLATFAERLEKLEKAKGKRKSLADDGEEEEGDEDDFVETKNAKGEVTGRRRKWKSFAAAYDDKEADGEED